MHEDDSLEEPKQDGDQDSTKSTPQLDAGTTQGHQDVEEIDPSNKGTDIFADLVSETGDLPNFSSEARVVLTPVDPALAHVYWEGPPGGEEKAHPAAAEDVSRSQPVLRVHEISDIVPPEINRQDLFDIDIDLASGSRFMSSLKSGASYFVELGFKTHDGRFFPLAQSNEATMPVGSPLPRGEESYMRVSPEHDVVRLLPSPRSIASSKILALARGALGGGEQPDTGLWSHGQDRPLFHGLEASSAEAGPHGQSHEQEGMGIERSETFALLDSLLTGLAQFLEFQALDQPGLEAQLSAGDLQTTATGLDLTEMSERSFISGGVVSS